MYLLRSQIGGQGKLMGQNGFGLGLINLLISNDAMNFLYLIFFS